MGVIKEKEEDKKKNHNLLAVEREEDTFHSQRAKTGMECLEENCHLPLKTDEKMQPRKQLGEEIL